MKRKTIHVRINKSLNEELKLKFPGVRSADLIQIMFDTSALKLEAKLRLPRVKKKK